tara:strand:+ start:13308 stop:14126 length:819 start_codon:yes stop_codon:yes gene_type:complete
MKKIIIHFILYVGMLLSMIPFLWMLITSLRSGNYSLGISLDTLFENLSFENYITIWEKIPLLQYTKNSVFISFFAIIGTVFSSSFVAYAFSILEWENRDKLFLFIIFTMMIPLQVTMIPVFVIYKQLGWLNSFKPLIVPAFLGGGAFNIFLFRQFFLNIPREIIDAAKMDGLNHFQIYWTIVLPMAKSIIATVSILTFMFTWNDFMGPLIYLSDKLKGTLALGVMLFVGQYQTEWGQVMAISILMIAPVILVFVLFQKYFISGLMFGGSKNG